MILLIVVAALSCAAALMLTPICRGLALRFGSVDLPDGFRKIHSGAIPRVGGVGIFLAVGLAVGMVCLSQPTVLLGKSSIAMEILPAGVLVFAIGLIDDLVGLSARRKLIGQVAAALLACASGVQIDVIAGQSIANTWWHDPLTVLWLIACANAFNLIDGVDGLATGVGLVATLTICTSAVWSGNGGLALLTAALSGALLGFLRYNFNPASIFLGDCGSLTIGFLLGCFAIIWSTKATTVLGMTAPAIALCVPFLEIAVSVCRRFLRGQPVFGPDRRHIHHRLLDRGLTPKRVAFVLYGAAGIAAGCSLLVNSDSNPVGGIGVIVCSIGVWIGVHRLQYSEFQEARRVIFGGVIARVINDRVVLRQFDENLRTAGASSECWEILTDTSRKIGINKVRLEFRGRARIEQLGNVPDSECWQLRIPLDGYGLAEFSLPNGGTPHPATLAPFADIVRRRLTSIGPWMAIVTADSSISPVNAGAQIATHG